jgi:hypothetical protein
MDQTDSHLNLSVLLFVNPLKEKRRPIHLKRGIGR